MLVLSVVLMHDMLDLLILVVVPQNPAQSDSGNSDPFPVDKTTCCIICRGFVRVLWGIELEPGCGTPKSPPAPEHRVTTCNIALAYPGKFVEALLLMSKKDVFRIVNRATDGTLRITDFPNPDSLLQMHTQIGIEDSSTDLELRGMPVFRGLIGPIPEGRNIVRYETPEVFEAITKEWSATKVKRRRRRAVPAAELAESDGAENSAEPTNLCESASAL